MTPARALLVAVAFALTPRPAAADPARDHLERIAVFRAHLPAGFEIPVDATGQRILREYGAVQVARGVTLHPRVRFADEEETSRFRAGLRTTRVELNGMVCELQTPAMTALQAAIAGAAAAGLEIGPVNSGSAARTYAQTEANWKSRVEPGLLHWVARRRLTAAEAQRIRALSPADQVPEILALEARGLFFSRGFDKSILHSVAPPGASQHNLLLAFDVRQHDEPRVRALLAGQGWHQTVPTDLPHFTYLGAGADDLPALGLRKIIHGGRDFWVPDL